jgi:hypothetical protein
MNTVHNGRSSRAGAAVRQRLARHALALSMIGLAAGLVVPPPALAALSWVRNGKIAFVSDADGDQEIYTVERDGSGLAQLTNNVASDTAPVFSPDGTRIAFASDRDGDFDIYVMKSDGTSIVNLTDDSPADETAPTWAPDGIRLAFTSDRTGQKQIFIHDFVRALGGQPAVSQLTTIGRNQDPSWGLVDGAERIFYTCKRGGNDEICSVAPAGGLVTKLTDNDVADQQPRYRSGRIYYQRKQGGDFEVWRMGADGSAQQQVTFNDVPDRTPVGSPDGKSIAFVRRIGNDTDLIVAKADGTSPVELTVDADQQESPDWQSLPNPKILPTQVYDVQVVPHGTTMDVSFKTTDTVTAPIVTLFNGSMLDGLKAGVGSKKSWTLTIENLTPGSTLDLKIQLTFGPGKYLFYEHPTAVGTLKRKVTVTARYAFVWNDSDPGTCGDLGFQLYPSFDIGLRAYVSFSDSNGCDGQTWNFPNRTVVVDDYSGEFLPMSFEGCDYENGEGPECASGHAELDLLVESGSFVRTRTVDVNVPYLDPDDDLDLAVTYDYAVDYHP